jgi:hypothetical protein
MARGFRGFCFGLPLGLATKTKDFWPQGTLLVPRVGHVARVWLQGTLRGQGRTGRKQGGLSEWRSGACAPRLKCFLGTAARSSQFARRGFGREITTNKAVRLAACAHAPLGAIRLCFRLVRPRPRNVPCSQTRATWPTRETSNVPCGQKSLVTVARRSRRSDRPHHRP